MNAEVLVRARRERTGLSFIFVVGFDLLWRAFLNCDNVCFAFSFYERARVAVDSR